MPAMRMGAGLTATLLLGVACSAAKPSARIEPQPWSKGAAIGLTVTLAEEHRTQTALLRGEFADPFEGALRSNLTEAGFEVIGNAPPGTLQLSATTPANLVSNPISVSHAVLSLDGIEIDRFDVDGRKLDCFAFWSWSYGNQQGNADCVARSLVAELLASRRAPRAREIAAKASISAPPVERPAVSAKRPLASGKIAVLELRNFTKDLTPQNVQYFTDLVRAASLRSLPGAEVMTRENLFVLLQASGKSLENCEGECEVDTGRRIGADAIVSGEIQKLGSRFKLTLRLHDTREGRLLSTAQASATTVEDLDNDAQRAASELFQPR